VNPQWWTSFKAGGELPFEADRYPLSRSVFDKRLLPLFVCRDCGHVVLWVHDLPPSATLGTVIAAALRHEADHHRKDTNDRIIQAVREEDASEEDTSEENRRQTTC
jgi:hypothetical protein